MIETPYYIAYESKIEKNLSLIKHVSEESGAEIIMAFKANALWKSFDIFRRYGVKSTASSLNEMLLGNEELHQLCHTYCPVYTDRSFPEFLKGSDHITFNSIAQFEKFKPQAEAFETATGHHVSLGLRINPEISVIETDIYNPCAPGARFGVTIENMPEHLPTGIEGFHFHALCESTSYDLEKVLTAIVYARKGDRKAAEVQMNLLKKRDASLDEFYRKATIREDGKYIKISSLLGNLDASLDKKLF